MITRIAWLICAVLMFGGCDGSDGTGSADAGADSGTDAGGDADPCHPPSLPDCEQVWPAPTTEEGISEFIVANAIPIECPADPEERWVFDVLADELEGRRVLALGEVHGSREMGHASAALFADLATRGSIDLLAMEIPMDMTDALNEYIETGSGEIEDYYGLGDWPVDIFWRTLPEKARELFLSGVEVRAFGVEVPFRLAWLNERLERIAGQVGPDAAAIIRGSMPDPVELGDKVDFQYTETVRQYSELIVDNLDALCAELDEPGCLRLETLARAYYLGALRVWPEFWSNNRARAQEAWMAERETLLFDNFRLNMPGGDERVYAHMGASHAAKTDLSAAGLLNRDHPPTSGAVYSVAPAYGPGSSVEVDDEITEIDPEPPAVSDVLKDAPADSYFIATRRPGSGCLGNPLSTMPVSEYVDGEYGVFDALLWFRKLSPQRHARALMRPGGQRTTTVVDEWKELAAREKRSRASR